MVMADQTDDWSPGDIVVATCPTNVSVYRPIVAYIIDTVGCHTQGPASQGDLVLQM